MLTKALVLTDGEADLLSRVLEEVKTKAYEESQISLDDFLSFECSCFTFQGRREVRTG